MTTRFAVFTLAVALLVPASASAFCGFYVSGGGADLYNEATQVVLMRHENMTALSMQNNYKGPTEDFAMVVPVPIVLQEENVKTLEKALFDKIDTLSAPRLVEYWERDPCWVPPRPRKLKSMRTMTVDGMAMPSGSAEKPKVVVEAKFSVAEYDIVILSATEANALSAWLESNKYKIPAGATPYLQPYIEAGMYFFVAKVDAQKAKFENGEAVLSPLRFHYESDEFSLPVRLGMINSAGKQDLLAYILAPGQRYETANYPNATIPTNLEVNSQVKDNFGGFYEALLTETLEKNPKAVVTEYAWAASSCDPCPPGVVGGTTVNAQDLLALGAKDIGAPESNLGWVLTRLHARYEPDDIGEDLVFRKAPPILGGREIGGPNGDIERKVSVGQSNNFQGRYIIRNEWSGPVECENPVYGRWGGPPSGGDGLHTAPSANTRGGEVAPANLPLAKLVKEMPKFTSESIESPEAKPAEEPPKTPALEESEAPPAEEAPKKKSGCATGGPAPIEVSLMLVAMVLAGRRRRSTCEWNK